MEKNIDADFTLVSTGDSLIFQKISIFNEPNFLAVRNIVKEGDVSFNNFETIIPGEKGIPRFKTDPTAWMTSPKYVISELDWMGFKMFSLANNHSMDYSEGGLLETKRLFEEAGLLNAGTGRILSEARSPAYLNTKKGRVALIAVNTREEDGPAGEPRGKVPGRPGLNPMRGKYKITLTNEEFDKVANLCKKLDLPAEKNGRINFFDTIIELGKSNDLISEPNMADLEGNIKVIEDARKNADYVFVSVHNHDKLRPGIMYFDDTIEYIAKFVEDFSRKAIDAGADAILGHGTHCLNGIEVYKGKPIFYGLGNFISQNYQANPKPYDWYEARGLHKEAFPDESKGGLYPTLEPEAEKRRARRLSTSVVAKILYKNKQPKEIILYPIEMERGEKQGGRPYLVDGDSANEILTRLARLSGNYGTKISIKKGMGTITI